MEDADPNDRANEQPHTAEVKPTTQLLVDGINCTSVAFIPKAGTQQWKRDQCGVHCLRVASVPV